MDKTSVKGKLLLRGRLEVISPLIIGSGAGQHDIDITVLKDDKGRPYIPATTLAGVWRHYFYKNADTRDVSRKQSEYFWGSDKATKEDDKYQSAFFLSDLTTEDRVNIRVRDGVKISSKGTAVDKGKFDYEVVEPGITFNLRMEVTLRREHDKKVFQKILATLVKALEDGNISIGAMTTKGFGRCRLTDKRYYDLDFSRKSDVVAWLGNSLGPEQERPLETDHGFEVNSRDFIIDAILAIKTSLIVRSYSGAPEAPDAVHISSNGMPVLPGTSLKGAVRRRAVTIINTLGGDGQHAVRKLFGWVDDRGQTREKYKSRVIVEETPVENVVQEIQSRIRIDRFTGGVQQTALFDTTPLWPAAPDQKMVHIKLTIKDYAEWEAGLLLLILKDLWAGDLPVGGEKSIGRGVLSGLAARISFGNKTVMVRQGANGRLDICNDDAEELEKFVQAFAGACHRKEVFHV